MLSKDIETAYKNAAKIVKTNIYATIATASLNGEPHVSPVYFSFDEDLRLYWASAVDAKHSKLIEQNPIISLVIFDSTAPERTGNGVYMNGFAEICSGDRLELVQDGRNDPSAQTASGNP
jgi:general stress protein 26